MKRLCNKTVEEQIGVSKRLLVFMFVCMLLAAALIVVEMIKGEAISAGTCSSIAVMICVSCANIKQLKNLEAMASDNKEE